MKQVLLLLLQLCQVALGRMSLVDFYSPSPPEHEWMPRSPVVDRHSRLPHVCNFPLNIVLVQDASVSLQDDVAQLRAAQIPQMVAHLRASHPDTSYALVSFKDRPTAPHGSSPDDYCFQVDSALSSDPHKLLRAFDRLHVGGGGDHADSHLHALLAAATFPGADPRSIAARLIVLVTDSEPHFKDDLENGTAQVEPFADVETGDCVGQYYPDAESVVVSLRRAHTYVAFLVFDEQGDAYHPHRDWQWVNSQLGQPAEFFQTLNSDSSNFWTQLRKIIFLVERNECLETV
eukprot:Gregarina_sp_Pseudo_9__2216@NODE_2556_length_955_cov_29_627729_g2343_i0_p1_GENE_NODE_2556_length_955_cov_29_627729_g2343_i0NODE_2556_length_955_cov_29_627729_g2343_i0_p1_ORF_typecomplete_len289_score72_11Integrin_beta/PF00362_18/1_2e21VWA/PF00092_28/1e07Med25_VWA/PF11265_8/2_4e07VWA_2/PF13519_6/4e05VWA_2/PF13519_6/1_2e04VWA_3/PF13768_6/6_5e05_NODE_2556_length_955_cov_29_627729_g2343_i02868